MYRFLRRFTTAGATLLVTALSLAMTSGTAQADDPPLATCTGVTTAHHDPGVTYTPADIDVEIHTSDTCVLPLLETVRHDEHFVSPGLSCLNLLNGGPGSVTLHWGNGQQSVFQYSSQVTSANGVTTVTQTGVITSGRFAGHNAVETLVGASLNLTACLSGGITGYSFNSALVIV
ncbi:hypothetical protein DMH12_02060 [Streptomyces sp. WAC 04229]|uniref:hypothetical protein n=1 Tax=Streptomyces sp. WAC 04229 TaxID=2203206 RepID=UPI000F73653F|nr:hypothetical protein [Streptomyces sp. WAC 04229]RSN64747.1 hypothetical protein DMH12_02060 [Streptomyces sp. WAC 04229]